MKRIFDFFFAFLSLFFLFIPLVILFILVRIFIGSPVIFRQIRPGKNELLFEMYKFRTMTNDMGPDGQYLPDNIRLTKFGSFLRSNSLDELPELFNVLKGDMSLVGPRPLLVEYLALYSDEQARRHLVRPGITGLAQVNGRNAISWEEKFNLDIWYVNNRTMWLDIKILFLTVKKVLKREGIAASGSSTMPRFTGKNNI